MELVRRFVVEQSAGWLVAGSDDPEENVAEEDADERNSWHVMVHVQRPLHQLDDVENEDRD